MTNLHWVVEFYSARGCMASFRVACAESKAVAHARQLLTIEQASQLIGTKVIADDGMAVTDIRKLAIHVQCRQAGKPTASELFKRNLRQLISRAPRIRWWA